MGISKMVRPQVVAAGYVTGISDRKRRDDGSVYRIDVTLQQESGAQLGVEFWNRDDDDKHANGVRGLIAPIGSYVALACSVSESSQYGASLAFEAEVSEDEIDRMRSAVAQPVAAK